MLSALNAGCVKYSQQLHLGISEFMQEIPDSCDEYIVSKTFLG